MELDQIADCIRIGAECVAYGVGFGVANYFLALGVIKSYISNKTSKINSKKQLETLVEEEKRIIGLEGEVKSYLISEGQSNAGRIEGDQYYIEIRKGANSTVVAHELYHINDGWVDKVDNKVEDTIKKAKESKLQTCISLARMHSLSFEYHLYREPQAVLYELKRVHSKNNEAEQEK